MLRFALAKQTTTHNIYKYIYSFSRRTLVWGIRIVRLWGLDTSVKVRRWPRKRTWDNDGTSLREQRNFTVFRSNCRPYFTNKIPRGDMDTPLRLRNLLQSLANGICSGMFDHRRAEITVMQFIGHSLPVHHFVTAPWDFIFVPYCQPSCILQRYLSFFSHSFRLYSVVSRDSKVDNFANSIIIIIIIC